MPIDWQRVCNNLRGHGSLRQHARTLGVSPGYLHQYSSDRAVCPRFDHALAILDLHYDLCPEHHRPEVIGEP